eukprot:2928776-Prymnesium_polylepis.1
MHPGHPPLRNTALTPTTWNQEPQSSPLTPGATSLFGIDNLRSWDYIKTKQGIQTLQAVHPRGENGQRLPPRHQRNYAAGPRRRHGAPKPPRP